MIGLHGGLGGDVVTGEQDNMCGKSRKGTGILDRLEEKGTRKKGSQIDDRSGDQNRNRYSSKGASEKRADLKAFSGSFPIYYFYNLPLTLFSLCPQLFGVSVVPIFVSSSICACNLMTWVSYLILVC